MSVTAFTYIIGESGVSRTCLARAHLRTVASHVQGKARERDGLVQSYLEKGGGVERNICVERNISSGSRTAVLHEWRCRDGTGQHAVFGVPSVSPMVPGDTLSACK
jgi:hypothetical protein